MRFFFAIGLALLASVAVCGAEDDSENVIGSNFYSELMKEIQKQQKSMAGKGLRELATEFFDNVQSLGRELTSFMRDAVAQARGGQVSDSSKKADKDKTIVELLAEMLAIQQQGDNNNQTETSRRKRETSKGNSDISALLTQLMQGFQSGAKKDGGESESTDGNSDSSNQQAEGEQQEANYNEDGESQQQQEDTSSVTAQTRIGNPAPVILIPGPPGKPGLPGPPGLPGKPGKIPNFRGLKAILTTRVAELLAFLALIFVLMIAKFLGLLGLLLGLVLPLYGKLKSAGVLVPGEENGYGAPAPSYGAPAPAYGPPPSDSYAGRRKRAIPMQFPYPLNGLAERVHSGIDAAQQKF